MLSSLGQIEGYKFMSGKLNNNDYVKFNEALSQLEDTNIFIDDTPGITIGEIRSKCRRLKTSATGLDLVIIDYLQLISGGRNYGANRQQEVSDISRSLKMLAMELNIPVIALCQLSRTVESREDKRPLMSDLRESGSIEQDADIVAFLYRDDYYNKAARTDNNTSLSELIIGKHRNGTTGTINLLFKRDTSTFLNFTNEGDKIPGNMLQTIFEKFYRVDGSRSKSSGTGGAGLGLAIAKEIVELHGGRVMAKSDDLKTQFIVTLPSKAKKEEGETDEIHTHRRRTFGGKAGRRRSVFKNPGKGNMDKS